ncbi:MAG: hypothetical protein L3J49_07620 [Desulfobulbaceae bacterium]|nr:hypothetical protein [Desulfobulbaceae bacterium]
MNPPRLKRTSINKETGMKKRRLFFVFGVLLAAYLYFYVDAQYSKQLSTPQEQGSPDSRE